MGLIMYLLLGIGMGIGRSVMPGMQRTSIVQTTLFAITGSFVGGFLISSFMGLSAAEFHAPGILGSIVGAAAVVFVAGVRRRRRDRALSPPPPSGSGAR